jgi:hypothetical protein
MRHELYRRGVDSVVSDELDRNEIARPKAPARRDKCVNLIACAQAVGTGIGRGTCNRVVGCRAVGNAIELLQLICERHDLSSVGGRIRGEGSLPRVGAIRGANRGKAAEVATVGVALAEYRDGLEGSLCLCCRHEYRAQCQGSRKGGTSQDSKRR